MVALLSQHLNINVYFKSTTVQEGPTQLLPGLGLELAEMYAYAAKLNISAKRRRALFLCMMYCSMPMMLFVVAGQQAVGSETSIDYRRTLLRERTVRPRTWQLHSF